MEERSKYLPGKDAVTLLEDGESHEMMADNEEKSISDGTYQWTILRIKSLLRKYRTLAAIFDTKRKKRQEFPL